MASIFAGKDVIDVKKTLFAALALVLLCGAAFAGPALERVVTLAQPNGCTFKAVTRGDERFHWTQAEDGYVVVRTESGWWQFAVKSGDWYEASGVNYCVCAEPPAGAVRK